MYFVISILQEKKFQQHLPVPLEHQVSGQPVIAKLLFLVNIAAFCKTALSSYACYLLKTEVKL